MLVLSRRTNETLVIDNNIRFTVLSVHGNQVRIGIEAPEDVIVLREEIIHNGSGARPRSPNSQSGDLAATQQRAYQPREYQQREHQSHEHQPREQQPELRSSADPYRRHDSSPEYGRGNEHGKRRGVLGLRRRRP